MKLYKLSTDLKDPCNGTSITCLFWGPIHPQLYADQNLPIGPESSE